MASEQVTLISGGGSGHEPGYTGMVGKGGLAANVCGPLFASPSASQVMAAIEQVQSPHGTLVIVMNYTGDCLHFGLAVERARAKGIKVDLVAVGDDVSVGRSKGDKVGRRGMAATACVIKLAGALAARGASLESIHQHVMSAIDHSATLAVAFDHCHLPGSRSSARLGSDELELGMGIHNETGYLKTKMMPAKEMVGKMMRMLTDDQDLDRAYLQLEKGDSVVVLVNNLGGMPWVELNLVVKETVDWVLQQQLSLERVYVGSFVTSLNMPGFSISLLVVKDEEVLSLLDHKVALSGWPAAAARSFSVDIKEDQQTSPRLPPPVALQVVEPNLLEAVIRGAAHAVIQAEPEITYYDTVLGDGDCGQTLKTAASTILTRLPSYPLQSTPGTLLAMAETIESSVGGTSCAIYCIFLNALASGLLKKPSWVSAAQYALQALMTYTKARVGDRTLMDTLCPFIDGLSHHSLEEAVRLAQAGAERTRVMSARLGRSSYLSDEQVLAAHVPDAGAYGLAELLKGMAEAIKMF
ncbi:hypothetical protein G6F60_010197 [Rhizopus arrhizus]|nr:hypothetical protein G6F23_009354 [Rhizopus arrhizus]KAG1374303.1 hypothetical protein G6F61_009444 [Rhizopus arrhizus]KAG1395515.1 hypothetical protein G6F60_010197 [Rhizopus arrhizus]KAG1403995.1 hypothetical protein G6F58_010265 [Rhizopus delemar]